MHYLAYEETENESGTKGTDMDLVGLLPRILFLVSPSPYGCVPNNHPGMAGEAALAG